MVRFVAESHPGYREGDNEDSIGWDEAAGFWLVADGMGGHVSGQLASQIACKTVKAESAKYSPEEVIMLAHQAIVGEAQANPEHKGMGTTIVLATIDDAELSVHWVGDSRAYLYRDGELRQVSVDHSFVELLRQKVEMTEEELRNHPQKNLVTQILGHDEPSPSHKSVALKKGDRILLCSDGLNDEVSDPEIAEVLGAKSSVEATSEALISTALKNGGNDNVSVVLMEYDGDSHPDIDSRGAETKWWPVIWGMALALALLIVVLVISWLAK